MNTPKKEEIDDDEDDETKLSWWEEKILFEAKEHTRLLKTINTAVQIIGVIILISAILAACSGLGLI